MKISYTTRGFELTDQIKKYTEEKLRKILSLEDLLDVQLTLEEMRHRFKAELLVHDRASHYSAVHQTGDVFKSINSVVDKIQKQIKRHKEKLIGRKRQVPGKDSRLAENIGVAEPVATPRIIRARKQDIKPMSQDEAVMQMDARQESFLIFRDTGSDKINILYKRKDGNYGLIDSEI